MMFMFAFMYQTASVCVHYTISAIYMYACPDKEKLDWDLLFALYSMIIALKRPYVLNLVAQDIYEPCVMTHISILLLMYFRSGMT